MSDLERAEEKLGEPWALTLVERKLILAELARLRKIEEKARKHVDGYPRAIEYHSDLRAALDSPR